MSDNKESSSMNEASVVKYNRDGTRCKLMKRSKIWEIFRIEPENSSKAICNECNGIISRGGGTGRSQCTTNLWKHLENRHPSLFEKISKYKEVVNRAEKAQRHPQNSKAWELFSVDLGDPVVVKCLECDVEIIRPNENVSTDVLWLHIMTEHPTLYDKCVNEAMESVTIQGLQRRRSSVWSEFTQHPVDPCKVICNTCDTVVSRGTCEDKLNTTNMRRHLMGNVHHAAILSKGQEKTGINSEDDSRSEPKRIKLSTPDNEVNDEATIANSDAQSSDVSRTPLDAQALLTHRPVDLFHTGLLGYGLYEQQKRGVCCDFSIVIQHKRPSLNYENDDAISEEVKIHSCIASLVSEKLRRAVESGSARFEVELDNIGKRIVQCFVEISYTGKLGLTNPLDKLDAQALYKLAKYLQSDTVCAFIRRTHPDIPPSWSQDEARSLSDFAVPISTFNHVDLHLPPEVWKSLPKINKRKNYTPISNGSSAEAVMETDAV